MPPQSIKVLSLLTSSDRYGAELESSSLADELRALGMLSTVVALAPGKRKGPLGIHILGISALGFRTLLRLRRLARGHDMVLVQGLRTLRA